MAKSKPRAQKTAQEKVKIVSDGARLMDAALVLVFAVIGYQTGHWFWWASAAFCAVTAFFKPLEWLYGMVQTRVLKVMRGR